MNTLHCDLLRAWKKLSRVCLTALTLMTGANSASAELVRYAFSGEVTSLLSNATRYFSLPISIGDPIDGSFYMDTLTTESDTGTAPSFVQNHTNGFKLTIHSGRDVEVTASNYTISITDNPTDATPNAPSDFLTVRFSSFVTSTFPTNTGPLVVDGNDQSTARMTFTFIAPNSTIDSTNFLPSASQMPFFGTIPPVTNNGALSNHSASNAASFRVGPLHQVSVPEPSALALAVVGALLFASLKRLRTLKLNSP